MDRLPDDALVVRGGLNLPENFAQGSGVSADKGGKLQGVSVNCGSVASLEELVNPNPKTGYPGIPNNQVGVTTVGKIRALGGEIVPSPTGTNRLHGTLSGLTPEQASALFRPIIPNPRRRQKRQGKS